jgi:hypothetical protein
MDSGLIIYIPLRVKLKTIILMALGMETWIQLEIINIAMVQLRGGSGDLFVRIPFLEAIVLCEQVKSSIKE